MSVPSATGGSAHRALAATHGRGIWELGLNEPELVLLVGHPSRAATLVLGTMAVVFMVSLIEAVKVEVWRGIQTLGLNEVMFVSAAEPRTPMDGKRAHLSNGLRREDAQALATGTDLISAGLTTASLVVLIVVAGSGSTLIACEQTGRQAVLMELDPPYCDGIVNRWEEFTGKKAERIPGPEPKEAAPTEAGAAVEAKG